MLLIILDDDSLSQDIQFVFEISSSISPCKNSSPSSFQKRKAPPNTPPVGGAPLRLRGAHSAANFIASQSFESFPPPLAPPNLTSCLPRPCTPDFYPTVSRPGKLIIIGPIMSFDVLLPAINSYPHNGSTLRRRINESRSIAKEHSSLVG